MKTFTKTVASGIGKTNDNLRILTDEFERLIDVTTNHANAITEMKDAITQINENSILRIFDNFKIESFKMFELLIKSCPR